MSSFDWDVFLLHSSADKRGVARLAERLPQVGFRVWFDRSQPHRKLLKNGSTTNDVRGIDRKVF